MRAELSPTGLAGPKAGPKVRHIVLATRPGFLPASLLPVLLGTASGYVAAGGLDLAALLLALAAMLCIHASANVTNDVYDDLLGTDVINEQRISPFTGGSRVIQDGIMSRRQMAVWAVVLFAWAAVFGAVLIVLKGIGVLLLGLAGTVIFVAYSAPPARLSGRGLGEVAVALAFGVLPVLGAHWLQAGTVNAMALMLSLPVGFWIADVLLINEVPDMAADGSTGKNTLAVRLGRRGAGRLYMDLQWLALLVIAIAVILLPLPWPALLGPAALVLIATPAATAMAERTPSPEAMTRAIKTTLAIHAAGTLWLTLWVLAV